MAREELVLVLVNDALRELFILQELHIQGPLHRVVTLGRSCPRKVEGRLRIFMIDSDLKVWETRF